MFERLSWSYFFMYCGGMLVLYWTVYQIAFWIKAHDQFLNFARHFQGRRSILGYAAGILAGSVTPFCSCTTVPVFAGLIECGVPLGFAMSFLIVSPLIDPPAVIIFLALFGVRYTLVYLVACVFIALLGGLILGNERLRRYTIPIVSVKGKYEFSIRDAHLKYMKFIPTLFPVILVAASIATILKAWQIPREMVTSLAAHKVIAIPGGVLLGGALYSDIGLLIPIAKAFLDKGVDVGLIFSFLIATAGIGIPSIVLLLQIFKKRLMFMYITTIFVLFSAAGYLISFVCKVY